MAQPSQDLTVKQLSAMQQEAETIQAKLKHSKSALQAVQNERNNQQTKFDVETQRLSANQKERLEREQKALETVIQETKKSALLLEDNVADLVVQKNTLEKELAELQETVESAKKELLRIQKDSIQAQDDLENARQESIFLAEQCSVLRTTIVELTQEEQAIQARIIPLRTTCEEWQERADNAVAVHDRKIAEKERAVAVLDARALKLQQNYEEQQRQEAAMREEFAVAFKKLDEWDKNLRLREAKVEQGEQKIIQNSNLLSL